MNVEIIIRPPTTTDRSMIIDSWAKSQLGQSRDRPHGTGPLSYVKRSDYFTGQQGLIEQIWRSPGVELFVAHHPEDENHVLGWVCGEQQARVMHFVYVSWTWRRQRVGTRMMERLFGSDPVTCTIWTRMFPRVREPWRLEYNPFPLYHLAQ